MRDETLSIRPVFLCHWRGDRHRPRCTPTHLVLRSCVAGFKEEPVTQNKQLPWICVRALSQSIFTILHVQQPQIQLDWETSVLRVASFSTVLQIRSGWLPGTRLWSGGQRQKKTGSKRKSIGQLSEPSGGLGRAGERATTLSPPRLPLGLLCSPIFFLFPQLQSLVSG